MSRKVYCRSLSAQLPVVECFPHLNTFPALEKFLHLKTNNAMLDLYHVRIFLPVLSGLSHHCKVQPPLGGMASTMDSEYFLQPRMEVSD